MNIQEAAVAFHAAASAILMSDSRLIARYKARVMQPQIGDMVIELSSFREIDSSATGTLLMANRDEGIYRILTFDGRGVTWHNADFIAAPINGDQRREFTKGPV
jgi:hypothetical protein